MIWVDIFKIGAEVHQSGHVVELTESFANIMLQNHTRLTNEGAEIVVLKEHERDGYVYGQVHGLRMWEDTLQAQMEFYREDDRMAFNAGMLRRFSPGFSLNFEHPHTGEQMGPTLLEVSFTAMPFQTNLRPPQETNPGVRLALSYPGDITTLKDEEQMNENTTAEESVTETEPLEALDPEFNIREAFDALKAEVMAMLNPEPAVAAELSDADRVIEQLSAKVGQLEDDKTRMALASAGITENVEKFVELKRTSPDLFAFAVQQAQKPGVGIQAPIGQPGTEAVDVELSAGALIEMAAAEGYVPGKNLAVWLAKKHPERLSEVLAHTRD